MITHGRQNIEWLSIGRKQMDFLSRGRYNCSFSPYNTAATDALLAQFPTQWPTIRDYGFAHPEIVGYMNAYAPEDAKIAYSLVEGIGTRWIVGDGNAYIRTGLYTTPQRTLDITFVPVSGGQQIYGARTSYGYKDELMAHIGSDNQLFIDNGNSATNRINENPCKFNKVHELVCGTDGHISLTVDGVTVSNSPQSGLISSNKELYLFFANTTLSYGKFTGKIGKALFDNYNWFLPIITGKDRAASECYPQKICVAGTKGMINLETGLFHPNANSSGSFTISESPS